MLPRQSLLDGSRAPTDLGALIDQAEEALRTWQPRWSPFVAAAVAEEAEERLGQLTELTVTARGGWPQAERSRLCFSRRTGEGRRPGRPRAKPRHRPRSPPWNWPAIFCSIPPMPAISATPCWPRALSQAT
ncbi:hypothetical protein [Cyanobium sp. ATX-6F1]|uniref:hypothetical protein n=1 Tax=Cyanobium sp. ATX-6F1 TaxID=3137388 RepID=UPI0039BE1DC8